MKIPVQVFGAHNMKNIAGAMTVLDRIGMTEEQFYAAIPLLSGANRRLEKVVEKGDRILFRDYIHAPSKVQAATEAVKRQYVDRTLLAVVELPAYSSLNKAFLEQYKGCLAAADIAVVYVDTDALAFKYQGLSIPTLEDIASAFERPDLLVFTKTDELQAYLNQQCATVELLLLMGSGAFGGLNINLIADKLS